MSLFPLDWLFPTIVASIVMNFIFAIGAIVYTVLKGPDEVVMDPQLSTAASRLSWRDRRHSSLSPQVVLYENLVRLSISNGEKQNKTFWQKYGCRSKQTFQMPGQQKS